MTEKEHEELFLKELTALTRKYRIVIGGCGCCGSPFLEHHKDGQEAEVFKDGKWIDADINTTSYSYENQLKYDKI